jgi:hypothetical protein
MIRWGVGLIVAATLLFGARIAYSAWAYGPLPDEPLPVLAGQTTTHDFVAMAGKTYNVYVTVEDKQPYVHCLLGESGLDPNVCRGHRTVFAVRWVLRAGSNEIERGVSRGICCPEFYVENGTTILEDKVMALNLPSRQHVRVELSYAPTMAALVAFRPRVVVYSPNDLEYALAGLVTTLSALLCGMTALIGAIMLAIGRRRYLAPTPATTK